ncbi:hypothetical protein K504DRAFT_52373 [Pleomassaria siparia CBS 279.74]|uniref:Uncharacterized protein n=1 Tax=Pleomassaria siparia CBS 279.74 TaxID=1314801 RepID=A0A6G1K3A0_9PLEO|nr:hypothetical protein K504DRAFT_52373 [Pleomassaria siparia CBS 279.74]
MSPPCTQFLHVELSFSHSSDMASPTSHRCETRRHVHRFLHSFTHTHTHTHTHCCPPPLDCLASHPSEIQAKGITNHPAEMELKIDLANLSPRCLVVSSYRRIVVSSSRRGAWLHNVTIMFMYRTIQQADTVHSVQTVRFTL